MFIYMQCICTDKHLFYGKILLLRNCFCLSCSPCCTYKGVPSAHCEWLWGVPSLYFRSYKSRFDHDLSFRWPMMSSQALSIFLSVKYWMPIPASMATHMNIIAATPRPGLLKVLWISGSMKHMRPASTTHDRTLTIM